MVVPESLIHRCARFLGGRALRLSGLPRLAYGSTTYATAAASALRVALASLGVIDVLCLVIG